MYKYVNKLRAWAYRNNSLAAKWRGRRMRAFLDIMQPEPGARVIDLGGTPYNWGLIKHNLEITLVNLPGVNPEAGAFPNIKFMDGDATDLKGIFPDKSFDIVFSNSVIEHVGDEARQEAFAREVHRLANRYWIQTPSNKFPIEAHTGVPLYWKLPKAMRPYKNVMCDITVLSRARMESLFSDGHAYTERVGFFEKSYTFYCNGKEKVVGNFSAPHPLATQGML